MADIQFRLLGMTPNDPTMFAMDGAPLLRHLNPTTGFVDVSSLSVAFMAELDQVTADKFRAPRAVLVRLQLIPNATLLGFSDAKEQAVRRYLIENNNLKEVLSTSDMVQTVQAQLRRQVTVQTLMQFAGIPTVNVSALYNWTRVHLVNVPQIVEALYDATDSTMRVERDAALRFILQQDSADYQLLLQRPAQRFDDYFDRTFLPEVARVSATLTATFIHWWLGSIVAQLICQLQIIQSIIQDFSTNAIDFTSIWLISEGAAEAFVYEFEKPAAAARAPKRALADVPEEGRVAVASAKSKFATLCVPLGATGSLVPQMAKFSVATGTYTTLSGDKRALLPLDDKMRTPLLNDAAALQAFINVCLDRFARVRPDSVATFRAMPEYVDFDKKLGSMAKAKPKVDEHLSYASLLTRTSFFNIFEGEALQTIVDMEKALGSAVGVRRSALAYHVTGGAQTSVEEVRSRIIRVPH